MLMAVSALLVILNAPSSETVNETWRQRTSLMCLEALLYYLFVYLFMNLGAFGIVALIRNQIFSEEIEDYNGLGAQTPLLCACMGVCLFSLVGVPPLGGFIGKFMIFASVFEAGKIHWSMWVILAIGCLNTVFSLFFYMRVLKAMFLLPRADGARSVEIPFNPIGAYVVMITVPILILGVAIQGLSATAQFAASSLLPQ